MHPLLKFLNELAPDRRVSFASACGTSVGYLRKAISSNQTLGEALCINIERESAGKVRCEQLRPTGVDWAYLRGTAPYRPAASHPANRDEARAGSDQRDRQRPGDIAERRSPQRAHERPQPRPAPRGPRRGDP